MKLVQMEKDLYNYTKIYVQVYCTLLDNLETSGFLPSSLSTQDRARAKAIAELAGIHTDAIFEYLTTNFSRETQSAKN